MAKNQFFQKLKEDKGARGIAVTIVAMLLVLTAIILTTVIANRSVEELPLDEQVGVQDPEGDTTPDDAPTQEGEGPEQEGGTTPPTQSTDALPSEFLLPVSGVLQKPHDAAQQVFSPTMGDWRVHLGIDIGTVAGASVSAMADGVIAQVWEDYAMGQCVAIKHGGDAYTIYKNLAPTLAESCVVGKQVRAGDVIGTVGESAANEVAEEPHLHLEMTVGGLQVNPYEYLSEQAKATLNEDVNYEDAS